MAFSKRDRRTVGLGIKTFLKWTVGSGVATGLGTILYFIIAAVRSNNDVFFAIFLASFFAAVTAVIGACIGSMIGFIRAVYVMTKVDQPDAPIQDPAGGGPTV